MSTPPNPPSTPTGPPTEPAGTPVPEADSIPEAPSTPAPAQPPSLQKSPAPAPTPSEPAPAPAPAPAPSFAPLTPPTPPAGPGGPGPGFGAPGPGPGFGAHGSAPHAWPPPPGAPFGGAPYPGYAQPAQGTGSGLATSALIVGGIGILVGLIPFLFWAGALLGLTAIGLGIGALVRSARNGGLHKSMSIGGTVLGLLALGASVGGFFLSAVVVDKAADDLEREREQRRAFELYPSGKPTPKPTPTPTPTPSQVPGLTSALPFGETFTYENGVKVSLSVPKTYKPKGIIAREEVKNAIQITITITNGSAAPHDVIYAMPNVRDDQGMTAEKVFDSGGTGGGVPKMIKGSILPGESASGVVAFELPAGTKSITADISAGVLLDDVKYAGPIG